MALPNSTPEQSKVPLVRAGFERLWRMLVGPEPISPVDAAYANWRQAQAAYDDAKRRGDTRGVGAAWKALKAARTECVRAELGARR